MTLITFIDLVRLGYLLERIGMAEAVEAPVAGILWEELAVLEGNLKPGKLSHEISRSAGRLF